MLAAVGGWYEAMSRGREVVVEDDLCDSQDLGGLGTAASGLTQSWVSLRGPGFEGVKPGEDLQSNFLFSWTERFLFFYLEYHSFPL